ncbi:phage head closure protein [Cereibacter sediminicola]|uniref:phage head closure protein n=1 Tax=Cereibacter sediminicola TaxID=2584941 RepID=UPI0011A6D093|nr:phage head closure protein [Cereibacter sediminicola]
MQAGKLSRVIEIHGATFAVDDFGSPLPTWTRKATLRAEIVTAEASEFIRGWGVSEETAIVFRTRFLDGITMSDRVSFDGQHFNIKGVAPIGRRRGLELRCVATGGEA